MAGRYTYTPPINMGEGKSNPWISSKIYLGVMQGSIKFKAHKLKRASRLDHISAEFYGTSKYWWIIAAASGIGWGLQVPEGTIIRVPQILGEIRALR